MHSGLSVDMRQACVRSRSGPKFMIKIKIVKIVFGFICKKKLLFPRSNFSGLLDLGFG